jgi:hypothetical protein
MIFCSKGGNCSGNLSILPTNLPYFRWSLAVTHDSNGEAFR